MKWTLEGGLMLIGRNRLGSERRWEQNSIPFAGFRGRESVEE